MGPRDYSTVAADNLSVGGISVAEGWLPASVNDAQRAVLADTAKLLLDQGGETSTTGSSNAYLLDLPSAPTAYADNLLFICKLNHAVTGAATININGLGVKAFKKLVDGVASDLSAGDGPAGHRPVCVYSSSDNAVLMLLAAPTFTHTGGETWPIQDRMKEQVYLLDFIPQSHHAAIRDGTAAIVGNPNFYDCSDAMDAAMDSITVWQAYGSDAFYEGGAEIIFPYGHCYFSRTIELKKTLTLTGYGQGGRNAYSTRLVFAPSITGITVNSLTGFEGDMDPPVYPIPATPHSKGGDASTIRNLYIVSNSMGVPDPALNSTGLGVGNGIGHGIWCRARATIENCRIQYFPQHGIYVRASAVITDTADNRAIYGNANNMYVSHVACLSNGGCGMYIDGPDTNAGLFMAMDFGSNELSAIRESSLIGNVHIMPHTNNNGNAALCAYAVSPGVSQCGRYYVRDTTRSGTIPPAGHADSADVWGFIQNTPGAVGTVENNETYPFWPYNVDGVTLNTYREGYCYWFDQVSSSSTLIGPYTEGGQPYSLIKAPSIVIGGSLQYDAATTGDVLQGSAIGLQVKPGLQVPSKTGVGSTRSFITSLSRAGEEALSIQVQDDGSPTVALASSLGWVWDNATGTWMIQHARNAGRIAQRFTTTLNTITGGRADPIGAGNTIFHQGIWLGRATVYSRLLSMAEAMPTTGQWAAGDLVLNALPLMGEPWGWRCILTGDFAATPPTFQPLRDVGSQQNISDVAFTLTPGTSPHHTRHTGSMTANRAVTLSTTGALVGLSYRITRTSGNTGGPWSLTVGTGPLKSLAIGEWCEVVYDGSAYYLAAFGSL